MRIGLPFCFPVDWPVIRSSRKFETIGAGRPASLIFLVPRTEVLMPGSAVWCIVDERYESRVSGLVIPFPMVLVVHLE